MQDYTEITAGVSATLGAASAYIIRLIFDRRKLKAEVSSAELDSETKAVELFERYAASLNPKIQHLEDKQEELSNAIAVLKLENTNLKIENAELKAENTRLKNDVAGMHRQITELQNALEIKKQPRRRGPNKPKS